MSNRRLETARQSEAATADALRTDGFSVLNLNELTGNCPFMDLLVREDDLRFVVQVKGTTTNPAKFTVDPASLRSSRLFAAALEMQAFYAFVQLADGEGPNHLLDRPRCPR
ncbi:Holliday junction resolvase-like predicted endonuclease [Nocardia sp. GAS34]|uniref:hypothetical protein n=1 Tax=unclassified Nocardia TaxID=2637762 RepID=UPI003D225A74